MNLYEQEIAKMKRLMALDNIDESKPTNCKHIVEYHAKGADGLTYGIVREGTKYYIKSAPKKDTEIISEDYDYIGGFMNKRQNEYNSFAKASKDLELKLMSLKESYNSSTPIVEAYHPYKKMDIIIEETESLRNEIQRQRGLMLNTTMTINEDAKINVKNVGVPEAPKTASNPIAQSGPFTEKTTASLDKDNVKKSSGFKKQAPFEDDGEVTDADMQSDKNPKGGDNVDSPHTEAAKYVPDGSVANQHPKGGKVTKVNETKRKVKMTEEQVLTWNDDENYLDTSTETSVGDTAPFDKKVGCSCNQPKEGVETDSESIDEEVAAWAKEDDSINTPTPGNGKVGDTAPFDKTVKEGEEENIEVTSGEPVTEDLENDIARNYAGFGGEEGEYNDENLDFDAEWESWLNNGGAEELGMSRQDDFRNEPSLDDEDPTRMEFDPSYGMENPYESKKPTKTVKEEKLDVFGKTPGYRKKPMTLPSNTEVAPNDVKDWNDDSVAGEEPFGKEIGSSAPYTDLVQQITNAVVTAITNMKTVKKKV